MGEERRKIGPYGIVRLLGKGGMSEVYEVENTRLGSRHALKLLLNRASKRLHGLLVK